MTCFNAKLASLLLVAGCTFGNASAAIIDFEHADAMGIIGGPNYDAVPIVTQGFTFSGYADVVDVTTGVYSGEGPAHSGNFVAVNELGPITMAAVGLGTFSLQDFWIHSFMNDFGSGTVSGYLQGVLVGSVLVSTTADWQNIVANFAQVDQVVIDAGGSFMIDDVNATVNASAVPEPASVALFGLGIAGLAALRRKRA